MGKMLRLVLIGGLSVLMAAAARAQCTTYTITVTAGFFPAQISWQLVNAVNVVVASGGAPVTQTVCLPAGCYTMRKFDSGNDGWSWAMFWIRVQPTNTVVSSGTLVNSGFATQPVTLGFGCPVVPCSTYTLSVTAGASPAQIGWNLVSGIQVMQAGGAPSSMTLCLPPGCYSIQLFDSFGDGWNGATWTLTNSMGVTVQSGTLPSGSKGAAAVAIGVPPGSCTSVGPAFASDCNTAVNVCADFAWLSYSSGAGAVNEAGWNTVSNPYLDYGDGLYSTWGTDNLGCLQDGEINTTWMIFDIIGGGTLEFVFGGGGAQHGYYDWILYPYTAGVTCAGLSSQTVAPVRCNYNAAPWGGTGITSSIPPTPYPGYLNYEPPLTVQAGERYLLGFSNHTGITANVLLDFGGTAVLGCQQMPLPVELLAFTGEAEGMDVRLRWSTATERNSLRFDVERSADGISWSVIGEVPAAGNSQQQHDYHLLDLEPLEGMNYYRLRMIDLDGSWENSHVVPVHMGDHDPLVFPNPSDGTIWVRAGGEEVRVFDATGRAVAFLGAGASLRQLALPISGVYLVRVGDGPTTRQERLVVR